MEKNRENKEDVIKIPQDDIPSDENHLIRFDREDIRHQNEHSRYVDGVKIPKNIYEPRDIDINGDKACAPWEKGLHSKGKLETLFPNDISDNPKDVDKMVEEYLKSLKNKDK